MYPNWSPRRIEEEVKLLVLAAVRATADGGKRVSIEDAAARFGVDLDELTEEDTEDEEG